MSTVGEQPTFDFTTAGKWEPRERDPLGTYFNPRAGRKSKKVQFQQGCPMKCYRANCGEYGHKAFDCSNPNLPLSEEEVETIDKDGGGMDQAAVVATLFGRNVGGAQ